MTKEDIAERISANTGYTKKVSSDMLESVLSIMKNTLEAGVKLKISGFGHFDVRQKRERKGRNPQTGETMTIVARKILTFKPSTVLKAAINGK